MCAAWEYKPLRCLTKRFCKHKARNCRMIARKAARGRGPSGRRGSIRARIVAPSRPKKNRLLLLCADSFGIRSRPFSLLRMHRHNRPSGWRRSRGSMAASGAAWAHWRHIACLRHRAKEMRLKTDNFAIKRALNCSTPRNAFDTAHWLRRRPSPVLIAHISSFSTVLFDATQKTFDRTTRDLRQSQLTKRS